MTAYEMQHIVWQVSGELDAFFPELICDALRSKRLEGILVSQKDKSKCKNIPPCTTYCISAGLQTKKAKTTEIKNCILSHAGRHCTIFAYRKDQSMPACKCLGCN